jgi:hypothetical protein
MHDVDVGWEGAARAARASSVLEMVFTDGSFVTALGACEWCSPSRSGGHLGACDSRRARGGDPERFPGSPPCHPRAGLFGTRNGDRKEPRRTLKDRARGRFMVGRDLRAKVMGVGTGGARLDAPDGKRRLGGWMRSATSDLAVESSLQRFHRPPGPGSVGDLDTEQVSAGPGVAVDR